jgi:O-antigen/teichoic acid export membrane protein
MLVAIGKASAKLLAGGAAAAALSLVSFAITARALGPHDFGLLLIAVAYTQTVGRLVGFQSWHVFIRFAPQLDRATKAGTTSYFALVRYSFVLDLCGALGAAVAVASTAAAFSQLSSNANVPSLVVLLFSLSLLCRVNGTALGIMRLSDRFGSLAVQTAAVAALKLALVFLAYLADGTIHTFAAIWVVCLAVEYLVVVAQAYAMLRAEGFSIWGPARIPEEVGPRSFWRLHVSANLWSGAQSLRELDSLIVATALSPAALAIYRAGRDISLKLNRLLDPLVIVVYPHLARARASNDQAGAQRVFRATTMITVAAGLVALAAYSIIGRIGIEALFGPAFVGVFEPGLVFMIAFVFSALGRAAIPAAMASDRARSGLLVTTLAIPPFLVSAYVLSVHAGVMGAALAFLAYSALTAILTVALVARHERAP